MGKRKKSQHRSVTQGRYTVTMLDDVNTSTHATSPRVWFSPRDDSKPSLVEGFHLPNRFRVDGLGVNVEMEVDEIRRGRMRFFACTSFIITPTNESEGIKDIKTLPVATLVRMAVKCARTVCMYYPAHYEGAVLDHKFRAVNATRKVGEVPFVEPVKLSPPKDAMWTDESIAALIGKPPRRRKTQLTPEFLQEVADVYNDATMYRNDAVQDYFKVGKPTADKWIAKCKELKMITDETKQGANK